MKRAESIQALHLAVADAKRQGKRVALVPTMGYLHEGHLALVEEAAKRAEFVVVSIFVNPLQFGPTEDLASYPRDLERDAQLLASSGQCQLLFSPSVEEMYPKPIETIVSVPEMSKRLCGRTRPTHFQGVATVVLKLLHIVQPDIACFGQKDGQQLAVIRRVVEDLNVPVEIVGVPTVREADGLAKSSRNIYLTDDERRHATILYKTLCTAREKIEQGDTDGEAIATWLRKEISSDAYARLDYAEVVSVSTLEPVTVVTGDVMLAVAAYFGKARLIDNIVLTV